MAEPFAFLNTPAEGGSEAPGTGTPVSTTEATNAKMLNQTLGKVLDVAAASSAAVITAINAIAAAVTASIIGGTTGTTINQVLVAKGTTGRALQPTPVTIDPSTGNTDFNGADVIDIDALSADSGAFATTLTKGGVNVAVVNQTAQMPTLWLFPEDGTFKPLVKSVFAWTITETTTITTAGTSTVTVLINGTPLGGTANSASTSEQSQSHGSANVVNVGDDISVTFASTSGDCENLSLNIVGTIVLAAS